MVRRNERSVLIEYPKSIGIAIRGEPGNRALLLHGLCQRRKVFIRRIGPRTVKQNISLHADRREGDALVRQHTVQPSRAASVHRIEHYTALEPLQNVEADHFAQLRKVWLARIDSLEVVGNVVTLGRALRQGSGALFNILRYLGQG